MFSLKARSLQEQLQALGEYGPGDVPVVYDPLLMRNDQLSAATLAHEEMHRKLTFHSTYGILWQMLTYHAARGQFQKELALCLDGQWGVQEAAATYAQLSVVALKFSGELDMEISKLPSELLGGAPYREWFDLADDLLPVSSEKNPESICVNNDAIFGIAYYALNGNVLSTFPEPQRFNPERFLSYLERHSPERRFQSLLNRLRDHPPILSDYIQRLRASIRHAGTPTVGAPGRIDEALEVIAPTVPMLPYIRPAERLEHGTAWVRQWAPQARVKVLDSDSLQNAPSPAIRYPRDWQERISPKVFPDRQTDAEGIRQIFKEAQLRRLGLACTITMAFSREVHLAVLPYPLGFDKNPSSWEDVVSLLEDAPTVEAVIRTKDALRIFREFPALPSVVAFLRHSWQLWDIAVGRRNIMRDCVQICMDVELTERSLSEILRFRNLGASAGYFVWHVHRQIYAACLADPDRPGIYGLLALSGTTALDIFYDLTTKYSLKQIENPLERIPHWLLLRFKGQGFVQ